MGMCFSKKKQQQQPLSPSPLDKREEEKNVVVDEEQLVTTTTRETRTATRTIARRADAEKKPVFVIAAAAQKLKSSPSASAAASKNSSKEEEDEEETKAAVGVVENNYGESNNNEKPAIMVRNSSCSKEEVDAILIQCGRLSRSSSNKASPRDAGGRMRYSGSKRSYDFDNDRSTGEHREDEDEEKLPLPRPSPRRRTPSRERAAGSGGGGSRRVSRSPGRRISEPDKPRQQQQQPGKMVSVPAREKVGGTARRVAAAATSRSNSPAAKNARMVTSENAAAAVHQPQSLSRSNSRKAEQSPFRRNPMAEIDDNSVSGLPSQSNANRAQKIGRDGEEAIRKPSHVHNNQKSSDRRSSGGGSMDVPKGTKSSSSNCVREQLLSCRPKEKLQVQPEPPETVEAAADAAAAKASTDQQENQINPRAVVTRSCRSSRRSSKDFDANPASYASLLLEDIQNYHQQSGGFSLPACLSKACSILDAVADLNSSSSSDNVRLGRGTFVPMVESEIVVEDDLTEPSLHKYISEMEPQESAGSNSFVTGQHWEPNSVGSTDRHWVDNDGEEMEEEVVVRGKRSSGGGGVSASNSRPCQLVRRGGGVGGRGDCSLPVAAAASATS